MKKFGGVKESTSILISKNSKVIFALLSFS